MFINSLCILIQMLSPWLDKSYENADYYHLHINKFLQNKISFSIRPFSYLGILSFRPLQNLRYICRRNELVNCNIQHYQHIMKPARGLDTRRCQHILSRLRCNLLGKNRNNLRWCWCSIRIHHMVDTRNN